MTPTIRPLLKGDAEHVAGLHLNELRTHFHGSAGRKLLACYYRALSDSQGACGYVGVGESGAIVGFVCGIWDARRLRRTLLGKEWWRFPLWGGIHLLAHPSFFSTLLGRLGRSGRRLSGNSVAPAEVEGYELRPIVVDAASRGHGVALALLQRLLEDARSRGFSSVELKTEVENTRANAFYKRNGLLLEAEKDGYNHYRIGFS